MTYTEQLKAILMAADKPLTNKDICEMMPGRKASDCSNMLCNMPGVLKRVVRGKHYYAIKPEIFEAPESDRVFTLPEDLWRGWRNPETGIQPPTLGNGCPDYLRKFAVER